MSFLFESFSGWKKYSEERSLSLVNVVLDYEVTQKGATQEQIWQGVQQAYRVMKDAVKTGLEQEMSSRSGMIAKFVCVPPTS